MTNTVEAKQQEAVRPQSIAPERDYVAPEVNIFETPSGYVLEADMPGVAKDGLEISLEGNELTLLGRRQELDLPEVQFLYRESRPADFRRTFELDPAIDTSKISAKMEQGILTVTLPKAERVKPRRIKVGD